MGRRQDDRRGDERAAARVAVSPDAVGGLELLPDEDDEGVLVVVGRAVDDRRRVRDGRQHEGSQKCHEEKPQRSHAQTVPSQHESGNTPFG